MTLKKPVKWLPLDVDALEDTKIMALVMALGLEGYGIYIMLIQFLAKQEPSYSTSLDSLKYLAFRNHTSEEKIKAVVSGFGLFEIEDNEFYSNSLIRRMEGYDNIRVKNTEKAFKRWSKYRELCQSNATALPEQCQKSREEDNRIEKKTKQKRRKESIEVSSFSSYVSDIFAPAWMKWFSYKIEIGDPYKTIVGASTQYQNLLKLSKEDPVIAMKIVDQSIANEWKGLFPLKTPEFQKNENLTLDEIREKIKQARKQ